MCDEGNWILSKSYKFFENLFLEIFWIFLVFFGEFFRRIFLKNFFEGIFWEKCFGRIFLGGFFGRIFWEEFFGRNYLVEVNKELMFLSRFWGNFVSMHRKKEGGILILRSGS
jgi:hypothetical protein